MNDNQYSVSLELISEKGNSHRTNHAHFLPPTKIRDISNISCLYILMCISFTAFY